MLRSSLAVLLLSFSLSNNAAPSVVPGEHIAGLVWSVSGASAAGFPPSCTTLSLDVDGAITTSGQFSAYGPFNCPAIDMSYNAFGAGYLTTAGNFALKLSVGQSNWVCTLNSGTFHGSCLILNAGTGDTLGTAVLTYVP